ncbi:hypothetical protein JCM33374_g1804 [Metschnikowia sp. JCM 33374]|nr:hypothetical protein JCM33374_g1804 [Metschnikowia sp. JCM 33374]
MEPDLDSLKTFSGLQTIMKHDFEYVNSKVKKVIEELQKIDDVLTDQNSYDSRRSSENEHSFEDLKTMIQVQRKILDRISQYMEESLWVTLSDGDTIRDNGRLAYAMLNNVDSFLNGHDTVD